MKIKELPRLVELRAAIILNKIASNPNRQQVNNILYCLKSYLTVLDEKYDEPFNVLLANSINEQLLGADKKELALTLQVYYDNISDISNRLGTNTQIYKELYPDMLKYVTQEYLNSLTPKLAMFDLQYNTCNKLSDFYDNYEHRETKIKHEHANLNRHIELKFMYIYNQLKKYFESESLTNAFIIQVCRSLKIDTDIINEIIFSKHLIYKKSEEHLTSNLGLVKDLVTFGYIEGWSVPKIATDLLSKEKSYLRNKKILLKDESNNEFYIYRFYRPTVLKDDKAVYEVTKFLNVMRDFYER